MIFCHAVTTVMSSVSEPLFSRGEDAYYTDDIMSNNKKKSRINTPIVRSLCRSAREALKAIRKCFQPGADRYLLRHETADFEHYGRLHPDGMSAENRQRCLFELKG